MMKIPAGCLAIVALTASFGLPNTADGQTPVFTRAMMTGGGTLRPSSYWVDPAGKNDSDNDSQAWSDFTLAQPASVTRVRWWGQAGPSLGFVVLFYNQDPNTTAVQPHIVGDGSGPIAQEEFPAPSVQSMGGGLYEFTVDLTTPVAFEANKRYFLSVVGLTPTPSTSWSWAQGAGSGWTFWWQRGLHMYYLLGGGRAFELSGDVAACTGDVDGSGDVGFGDILAIIGQWGPCAGCPADVDGSGDVGFGDILAVIGQWGPCG